jgi:hypothetical protein
MAVRDFKSLGEAALTFGITVKVGSFVQPIEFAVDERLRADLQFNLVNVYVRMSESAMSEFVIAPVLREVWKAYSDSLQIWSHIPFGTSEPLTGFPDYFFSRKSPLGLVSDQPPYVLVVEAKKDDFDAGWGQCLATMLAAQQLNGQPPRTIFGCVSNGITWEFGKLHEQQFIKEFRDFVLSDLPGLFAAWNYLFAQAKEQALAPAA